MTNYHCDKCEASSRNRSDIQDYYVIIENTNCEFNLMLCDKCRDELIKHVETTIHDKGE